MSPLTRTSPLPLTPALLFVLLVPLVVAENRPSREQVLAHLERMRASEKGMMNVAPAEGQYLSNLIQKITARRVLEIGTSNGYSGIWFALGLRATGGKLLTLDIDEGRRSLALKNFKTTGVDDIIESRLGDALTILPTLKGPFDLVFIDAWKPDYKKYLDLSLPLVRSGGVIAAHNVVSHADEVQDFLAAIRTNPQLKTEIVRAGPGGLSISYKK